MQFNVFQPKFTGNKNFVFCQTMDVDRLTKEQLKKALLELRHEHHALKESYAKDVAELKQVEQNVIRERILLRTIIESIPDAIYIKDLECRKLLANKTDCENNGCEKEEDIIGKSDFDFFPPDIARQFYKDDQMVLQGERVINREEILQKPNGDKLWLLTTKIPLYNEKGDVSGIVGIGHNITDRKHAEKQIKRQNLQLRELNAQKDKFFSIIAHDLRSPFNAILGISELLVNQIGDADIGIVNEYARKIYKSSRLAMNLLTNLLEWARIKTGRIEFKPECFELGGFIEDSIQVLDGVAAQKSITIQRELPPNIQAYADKPMIGSVIRNLVSNAIKYTPRDGKIIITANKGQSEMMVLVGDNGVGIAAGRLETLFQIDQSDSTPGTNNEKGTGLGLILCKEFIDKHRGRIWVESEEGKGSTFYFTLPFGAKPE